MHCNEARTVISHDRAVRALRLAVEEMNLEAPPIVVVRCSAAAAEMANVRVSPLGGGVVYYVAENGEHTYYLWIVGEDTDECLASGLVHILAFHHHIDPVNLKDHQRRVVRRLMATVSAGSLLPQRSPQPRE